MTGIIYFSKISNQVKKILEKNKWEPYLPRRKKKHTKKKIGNNHIPTIAHNPPTCA